MTVKSITPRALHAPKPRAPTDPVAKLTFEQLVPPGSSIHSATNRIALEALRTLYEGLASWDEKIRAASARDIAYVWSRLPTEPPGQDKSPEQRALELRAALAAAAEGKNAELSAALADTGWHWAGAPTPATDPQ